MTAPSRFDVLFVGAGFRTTTFLASAPEVARGRVGIIDRRDRIGAGAFGDYALWTSSTGAKLLAAVRPDGAVGERLDWAGIAPSRDRDAPIRTEALAGCLERVGAAVAATVGPGGLFLGRTVVAIDIGGRARAPVVVSLDDGSRLEADHVVLATGREERPHPELAPWADRCWRSEEVLSWRTHPALVERLGSTDHPRVAIAGSSHSALSVVDTLLSLPDGAVPEITLVQRGPARLSYGSLAEARREQDPHREVVATDADVCPRTGIVFRDRGLRHRSKELYQRMWAGEIEGAAVFRVPRLADAAPAFDDATIVVQALGYHGRVPPLVDGEAVVRAPDSPERLAAGPDGALLLGGTAHDDVSVLRVEPTPPQLADAHAYGSSTYALLADRLTTRLRVG